MIAKRWIVLMSIAGMVGLFACDHLRSKGSGAGANDENAKVKTAPENVMPSSDRYGGSGGKPPQ